MANIKLSSNNWETSGIYDLTQAKTQRTINSELITAVGNINFADVQNVSTASTDLDSYTSGGIWYFSGSYTPTNKPSDSGSFGFLIVLYGGNLARLAQYWIDSSTSNNAMWMRSSSSSSLLWGDWKRLVTNKDLKAKEITPTIVETLPTGVTAIGNVVVVQSGNVVTVSIDITRDSTAITSYRTIATGMPTPKTRPMSGSYTIPFGQISVAGSTSARPLNVSVSSSGNLNVIRGEAAGQYMGTFIYITDEI